VPSFESIVDQEKPLRLLSRIIQNGKIPHALLFTGIEGVGKRDAAIHFAMACNCLAFTIPDQQASGSGRDSNLNHPPILPCGACKSCRKIASGNHPDVISVQPEKARIRIGQIRQLYQVLALKPYEARYRFVILSDAHAMNPEAANSLLKVLEEPPDRTILILTAYHLQDLLPTIASRCQHIRFNPISHSALVAFILKQREMPARDADHLATLAKGSLKKAGRLVSSGWIERRAWILRMMGTDFARQAPVDRLTALLAFSEKLAQNKDALSDSLEILKMWFRDLMIYPLSPDKIVNRDHSDDLNQLSQEVPRDDLLSAYDAIQSAQDLITGNANPRLTLDVMLMNIMGFDHEKNRRYPV
jgi:DNA polymerase III subunit delta'